MEEEKNTSGSLVVRDGLDDESKKLMQQIVAEQDENKTRDLMNLFNLNQDKKNMLRLSKQDQLLDIIVDQALERLTKRPDEIPSKDLLDYMKAVFDMIERGQKRLSGVTAEPPSTLIQINDNGVHIDASPAAEPDDMTRESKDKVKNAVMNILRGLNLAESLSTDENVIDAQVVQKEDTNNEQHN